MKTENPTLTNEELTKITGLTARRHLQLVQAKYLPHPKRGIYPAIETLAGFIRYQRELLEAEDDLYHRERGLLTQARRKLTERQLEIASADLIPGKLVREHQDWLWRWLRIAFRQQVELGLPPVIMQLDATKPDTERFHQIREVLERGVDNVYGFMRARLDALVAPAEGAEKLGPTDPPTQ